MNLTRCKNGHFYDTDKFGTCPHCLQNSNADQSDATESIYSPNVPKQNQGFSYADDVTCAVNQKPVNKPMQSGDETEAILPPLHTRPAGNQDETEALDKPFRGNGVPSEPVSPQSPPPVSPAFSQGRQPRSGQITPERIPGAQPGSPVPDYGRVDYPENNLQKQINDVTGNIKFSDDEVTQRISFAGRSEKKVDLVVGWLVCVKGNSLGKSFCLRSGKNFIGRDSSMDVVIPDDRSVSRNRHAIIIFDPKSKAFLVEPGMSRELFYLDDDLVLTPQVIKAYQVITVGNTDLMFVPLCGEHFDWNEQIEKNEGK